MVNFKKMHRRLQTGFCDVYSNSTMVELQTIITRQNRVQLRRPTDDLSSLVSLDAVCEFQNLFSSQSLTPTWSFKYDVILKLKYTVEDQDEH